MTTLLVITSDPGFAAALRAVLGEADWQLIVREELRDADSLLGRGVLDAVVLDADLVDARAVRLVEEVRAAAAGVPVVVCSAKGPAEFEEDAYLAGAAHVVAKPPRARLVKALLLRLCAKPDSGSAPSPHAPETEAPAGAAADGSARAHSLATFRRFSGILARSLDPEALLREFLLLLREIVGVNRAVVFLRRPGGLLSPGVLPGDERWMRCACALGIEQSLMEHFALSLSGGIGGYLNRQGRILRLHSADAQGNREVLKEFQLVGGSVALPILDRQSLIGAVVLDDRLTGEPYANEELAQIFHMLEEVGIAIRNGWAHQQLAADHRVVEEIIGQFASGCVVVGPGMAVMHANPAARLIFLGPKTSRRSLEFADLPQDLGSRVFSVMKTGVAVPPFAYRMAQAPANRYRVSVEPFKSEREHATAAVLLLIEDVTEHERTHQLEIEAANLRLVKTMAEHLAHEIGNSLVPISTHQQLLDLRIDDPDFRGSLAQALSDGVRRIARLSDQMVFLAREKSDFSDRIPIADLIREAFREARTYFPTGGELSLSDAAGAADVAGDRRALRHAFREILLNALQASPPQRDVAVRIGRKADPEGAPLLEVEVRDLGKGFTRQTAESATDPFFSTRNVGLGLGLTVSRKIIEEHRGQIEIASAEEAGVVKVSLPTEN